MSGWRLRVRGSMALQACATSPLEDGRPRSLALFLHLHRSMSIHLAFFPAWLCSSSFFIHLPLSSYCFQYKNGGNSRYTLPYSPSVYICTTIIGTYSIFVLYLHRIQALRLNGLGSHRLSVCGINRCLLESG